MGGALYSYLSVLVYSVKHLLGHELLQVRDRGLGTAPDEAPLQLGQVAAVALEAHVHLLVLSVVVGLQVGLVQLVRRLVHVRLVLRQVLGVGQVALPVELAFPLSLIWNGDRDRDTQVE